MARSLVIVTSERATLSVLSAREEDFSIRPST